LLHGAGLLAYVDDEVGQMIDRRGFLTFSAAALIAAPAIIPVRNLMKLPRVPFVEAGSWIISNRGVIKSDAIYAGTITFSPTWTDVEQMDWEIVKVVWNNDIRAAHLA
jgi:hypothetical protein